MPDREEDPQHADGEVRGARCLHEHRKWWQHLATRIITEIFQLQVHQQEIRERMESDEIDVPQLFVDGQYIGVMNCQLA